MAFLIANFDEISKGPCQNNVMLYSYANTADTLATIIASGYFNSLVNRGRFKKDDLIYVKGSDDKAWVEVTSTTGATPVTVQIASNESIELAEGSMLIGNSSGISTALDVSTDGQIIVGNGTTATSVAVSGDATLTNAGVLALTTDAVQSDNITDANVTIAKLAAGIQYTHRIVFAGPATTVGGAAAEAITIAGALATDTAFVQMVDDGTNDVTIVNAVMTTDTLTVTFSGDPSNDTVINYQIVRTNS